MITKSEFFSLCTKSKSLAMKARIKKVQFGFKVREILQKKVK